MARSFIAYLLVLAVLADISAGQDLNSLLNYFGRLTKEALAACPDGKGPEKCSCDNNQNVPELGGFPFSKLFKPGSALPELGPGFALLDCSPGDCYCANGKYVDARPPEMKALLATCPDDKIVGCHCAYTPKQLKDIKEGKSVERTFLKRPFDLTSFLLECRPTDCTCEKSPDVERPLTGFGCPQGGAIYCNSKKDFICKEQGRTLKQRHFINAKTDNKCICEDGSFPVCRSKSRKPEDFDTIYPLCPNGDLPDFTIGSPGSGLTQCQLPDDYRQHSIALHGETPKLVNAQTVGDVAP